MAKGPVKVTDQQRAYVDAFLETGNKRASAKAAGYDGWATNYATIHKSRGVQHELMSRAVENRQHEPMAQPYVLATLQEVVERSMQATPVKDSRGKPVTTTMTDDDGNEIKAVVYSFDARAAISALSKLGEHLALWTPPKESEDAQDARSRTVEGELKRIADALEGRAPKIEAAPVKVAHDKAEKPSRRLN